MPDEDRDLELIPRAVRSKLDRAGIKLHLTDWQALPLADRRLLRDLPGETAEEAALYGAAVERVVVQHTGQRPDRLELKDKG